MSCSPQSIPRENPSPPENRPNLRLGSQDMQGYHPGGYFRFSPYILEVYPYSGIIGGVLWLCKPVPFVGLEMPVKLGIDPFNIFVVHSVPSYLASSYFVPSSR